MTKVTKILVIEDDNRKIIGATELLSSAHRIVCEDIAKHLKNKIEREYNNLIKFEGFNIDCSNLCRDIEGSCEQYNDYFEINGEIAGMSYAYQYRMIDLVK